jgi:tRNA (guanine-N7-)-methyltransferase
VPAGEVKSVRPRHVCSPLVELASLTDRLDLEKIFGRNASLHVDLGCGDGSFLCAMAQLMPKKNFLGVERLMGRIRSSAQKAAKLPNVRLLRIESSYAVRYLLPAGAVETFYLLFPDPWPKRRHHGRRIVTPDFLNSVHVALGENGVVFIATDHLDYFREVKRVAGQNSRFTAVDVVDVDLPLTKFHEKFRVQGAPVHWLELRKISLVR